MVVDPRRRRLLKGKDPPLWVATVPGLRDLSGNHGANDFQTGRGILAGPQCAEGRPGDHRIFRVLVGVGKPVVTSLPVKVDSVRSLYLT